MQIPLFYCIGMVTTSDTNTPHPSAWQCTFLTAPLWQWKNKSRLHKWPGSALCLPGMASSAITSQTVNWKGGKLEEMMEAKGESEEEEKAFWFIFKDASYCIFNHLPRCGGTTRQLDSRNIEFTHCWVNSLRRFKLGFLLCPISFFLPLLFYHSSFPSL